MKKKAICIHGHFYQPPRENPWLEAVEIQDSAEPFHDWNERITVECYAPNGASRLMDGDGRIRNIVNNYASISFNFGPTLLSWMEENSTEEYRRIVEADRASCDPDGTHGNAIALPYNHMIMPLASERDRETQMVWGLSEFQRHFGRVPEGMWLPETAVDLNTLNLLAGHGIRFTILAPSQAKRFRPKGERKWVDVAEEGLDTRMPYSCRVGKNRSITIFFYHAEIAHDLAFGDLLLSGERLADRLVSTFDEKSDRPQLVHAATDGETFGHHRAHADMALAYALSKVNEQKDIEITNYARWLTAHPPEMEVEIHENSSWSCAHGIERWRSDCGCKLDPGRNWQQRWRSTLRNTFDWLRAELDPFFEENAGQLVGKVWDARNDYISVIASRRPESVKEFCDRHQRNALSPSSVVRLLKLLEMQRHGLLMYTSCGWFFDDISGIEPVQNLKYACRAMQLAAELGLALEEPFLERLAKAESNVPELGNGAEVYRQYVRTSAADLKRVAAHVAMEAAIRGAIEAGDHYCYKVAPRSFQYLGTGGPSLTLGRLEVESQLTGEDCDMTFVVLRSWRLDAQCWIRATSDIPESTGWQGQIVAVFENEGLPDVVRAADLHFGETRFSLKDLFLETRREVLADVFRESLDHYKGQYRSMFEAARGLMDFARQNDSPIPKVFLVAAESVLNDELKTAIQVLLDEGRGDLLAAVVAQARRWRVPLEVAKMEPRLRQHLNDLLSRLVESPNEDVARVAARFVTAVRRHELPLFAWRAQNLFQEVVARQKGERESSGLQDALLELGEALGFRNGGMRDGDGRK